MASSTVKDRAISDEALTAFKRQKSFRASDKTPFCNGYFAAHNDLKAERDKLLAENARLKSELTELRSK